MVAVPVTPEVLVWARKERSFTLEAAATLLELDVGRLESWENGRALPTLGQLEKMAQRYRIPLASLLMPQPLPPASRRVNDFRAFGGIALDTLSQETIVAIEEAEELATALADLREVAPHLVPYSSVPIYAVTDDPNLAAAAERRRIGCSVSVQLGWQNSREAFLRWRESIEGEMIFTYQLKLGEDDARGFAIWDDDRKIPIVVVDQGEEGYGPKTFTLLHEYAHILLRQGGITGQAHNGRTERFCNVFAAAFLMPVDEFTHEANRLKSADASWTEAHLRQLADSFKVSMTAVALHLQETGLAGRDFYQQMLAQWANRTPQSGTGRADHADRIVNRLGTRHVRTVADALAGRIITSLDVYELTRVKPQHFGEVTQTAINRREAYGPPTAF